MYSFNIYTILTAHFPLYTYVYVDKQWMQGRTHTHTQNVCWIHAACSGRTDNQGRKAAIGHSLNTHPVYVYIICFFVKYKLTPTFSFFLVRHLYRYIPLKNIATVMFYFSLHYHHTPLFFNSPPPKKGWMGRVLFETRQFAFRCMAQTWWSTTTATRAVHVV